MFQIETNHCVDPCKGFPPLENQGAIFRSPDDLQILSKKDIDLLLRVDLSKKDLKKQTFIDGYTNYGLVFFPYILLQGIWTTCFGRRSPIQVRDKLHLTLTRRRLFSRNPATPYQKWVAKHFALAMYAWAILITLICPPLFMLNLVANELNLNELPESETGKHIGAWSPYASTILVLLAAFAARFHRPVTTNIKKIARYWVFHIPHKLYRRDRARELDAEKDELPDHEALISVLQEKTRQKSVNPFWKVKQETETSTWNIMYRNWNRLRMRFLEARQLVRRYWRNWASFRENPDECAKDTNRHGHEIKHHYGGTIRKQHEVKHMPVNAIGLHNSTHIDAKLLQSKLTLIPSLLSITA